VAIAFDRAHISGEGDRTMKEDRFAADALRQMGCEALEALLRKAPLTHDPEELRLRNACWAAVAQRCARETANEPI
jgi:hypothetical protein